MGWLFQYGYRLRDSYANPPYDLETLRSDPVRGQRPARSEVHRERSDSGDVLLDQPLFCVPQRIGIDVGWVDVKGFLIMPALRKSTHHSKGSTGKKIKSISLSFWWVGY